MPPGRPPPTVVRRTAWEFAGLIVANSRGFLRLQTYSGRGARSILVPLPEYARRDLRPPAVLHQRSLEGRLGSSLA